MPNGSASGPLLLVLARASSPLAPLLRDRSSAPQIHFAAHVACRPGPGCMRRWSASSVVRPRRAMRFRRAGPTGRHIIRAGLAGRWKTAGRRGGRRWPGRCYQWLIARGGEQADPINSLCARVACVIICPRRLGSLRLSGLWPVDLSPRPLGSAACRFRARYGVWDHSVRCIDQPCRVRAGLRGRLVPHGSMASRGRDAADR